MDSNIYNEILPIYQSGKISWQEIADKYGFSSKDAARSQFKRERKKQGDAPVSAVEHEEELEERERTTYTESEDSIHVVCDSKRIRTRNDVIEFFAIDETVWEVKEFTVRTSEGYRKDRKVSWHVEDGVVSSGNVEDSGKILLVPMMHTETKFARKDSKKFKLEDIDKFFNEFKYVPIKNIYTPKGYDSEGVVIEINIADIHVGNAEYNAFPMTIEQRVDYVIEDILKRTKNLKIKSFYLVQLGDILQYDTEGRTTTGGTKVTYSGDSNSTIFDRAISIMINAIEKLKNIAPVDVICIFGNHDRVVSYGLSKAIEFYYRNDKYVTVDAGHDTRKFRKFGNNLVFWQHGDMSKKNIKSILYREAREEYGSTRFAEIHCGHWHHQQTLEEDGMIIRYLPSLTSADEWHQLSGYVGAIMSVCTFVWDLETGLRDIWFSNIPKN